MNWRAFFSGNKKVNKEIQSFVRHAFNLKTSNTVIYEQALRHSSAATKQKIGIKDSNERLEFLGDAILDGIVAHYLYSKYSNLPEGELTKMKSKIVRRENLNMVGYVLGIDSLMKLNLGKQEMHESIVGNALEAIIGAIYLDKGYIKTRDVVLKLLKQHGLDTRVHDDVDYKSKLHEWSQKYKRPIQYKVLEHRNEGGASFYRIAINVEDEEWGIGEGNSKKSAEQKASKIASDRIFGNNKI